ncbi:imelysin family protein [Tistrella mobilis]|uniref:imelysin family protein n=1 Tax=Tistrella mobilis TaxID=171437 RepID=UPI0035564E7A
MVGKTGRLGGMLLGGVLLASGSALAATGGDARAVVTNYANIAEAAYGDSLTAAKTLQTAVKAFIAKPGPETLAAAKAAWIAANVPYKQTEAFRFGNAIVDEWEGQVNAWPLDEGLIDYVDSSYMGAEGNAAAALNVIANKSFTLSGKTVDASKITPDLLRSLHEAEGEEANVATGYHAIEFLLWGQDLNGTGPGAGNRPWTDYDTANCTGGNCDRRAAYLQAATDLLVEDLSWMAAQWGKDGEARKALADVSPEAGLSTMFTGLGSLSYGELAGERMKLGLLLNDPEEEHDCFSDNTHNSHYYDAVGMWNVYTGHYVRIDGSVVEGPSLSSLVAAADQKVDADVRAHMATTLAALGSVKATAEAGTHYDQLLAPGNDAGAALLNTAIDALVQQTRSIERAVTALKLEPVAIEGSDSLDQPTAVFK